MGGQRGATIADGLSTSRGSIINNPVQLIFRHFWLVAIGFCFFSYLRASRLAPPPSATPAMIEQIRFYRRVWFGSQSLVWILAGIGILTGSVKDLFSYMQPRSLNPFALAFAGLSLLMTIAFARWIFSGGAKKVVELQLGEQLATGYGAITERGAKILAILGVLAVPLWLVLSLTIMGDIPGGATASPLAAVLQPAVTISPDGYQVVYDVRQFRLAQWSLPLFGLVFVVIGIGLVYFRNDFPIKGPAFMRRVFPFFWLGFAILWATITVISTLTSHRDMVNAMATGAFQTVEGEVTDFVPMPAGGHGVERFCIEKNCFAYSDYQQTGSFNNTASHGGPVRAGLVMRVSHVGDSILKLEIAPKKN